MEEASCQQYQSGHQYESISRAQARTGQHHEWHGAEININHGRQDQLS